MPGHDLIVPQGGAATIEHRREALDAFAVSAKSAVTRRAYRADAHDFVAGCAGQGAEACRPSPGR